MKSLFATACLTVCLVVSIAAFLLVGEGPDVSSESPVVSSESHALSERSVYQISSEWYDQDGRILELASLSGRPQLVAMVFTHCGYSCPRIVDELRSILRDLSEEARSKTSVLLVSIDPDRDTPEALKHFSKMHNLPSPQWTLIGGSDVDVRELSAVLGVRYKKEAGGEFAHSNTITLLNAGGEIVARNESLDGGRAALVGQIREML